MFQSNSNLPSQTSRSKLLLSIGFLFVVLILPVSMAAIYRVTNYTPKAIVPPPITPTPVATATPTPVPVAGQLWVYDTCDADRNQIKIVIYDQAAPATLSIESFNYNPLTDTPQVTQHSTPGICSGDQCAYTFYPVNSAKEAQFWQYWKLDTAISDRYQLLNQSKIWDTDTSGTFYRKPLTISTHHNRMPSFEQLPYYPMTINQNLAQTDFIKFHLSNLSGQRINNGWGLGFKFDVKMGQKLEILANESDHTGSYIKTYLYDPSGQLLTMGDTRIRDVFNEAGEYYLIVSTFDQQSGKVELVGHDLDAWEKGALIQFFVDSDDSQIYETDLLSGLMQFSKYGEPRYGRQPFKIRLTYPKLLSITKDESTASFSTTWAGREVIDHDHNITIEEKINETPLHLIRTCVSNGAKQSVKYQLTDAHDGQSVIMTMPDGQPFAPGYEYLIDFPYNWKFKTIASSGQIADVNGDSLVDMLDYSYLTAEIFTDNQTLLTDFDCSGEVDLMDYSILLSELGTLVVSPSPTLPPTYSLAPLP